MSNVSVSNEPQVLQATIDSDRAANRRLKPKTVVAITYVCGSFMSAMDIHVTNVALPHLSRSFHEPLASVEWAVIGYSLALAVFVPGSGWIGDRFGSKRIFLGALFVFTAASAACGQSHNLSELVTSRIVQGAGAGMLTPVGTTMLYRAYPPAERARLVRILMFPILCGPVIAQPISGLLVTKASWRWSFYMNVPIGLAAFVIGLIYLREHREPRQGRLDFRGFALSALGLAALLYAISQGPIKGWTERDVFVSGCVGAIALAAFVFFELRTPYPMLRLSLLRSDRLFRYCSILTFMTSASMTGGLLYLGTLFLQEARGLTALNAGLTTFSVALGVILSTQTVGRLYTIVGPRRMSGFGALAFALMLSSFVLIGAGTNLWIVRVVLFFAGFTNSANSISIQTSQFATISPADTSHAAALVSATRQTAASVSVAVSTMIVSMVHGSRYVAFHDAFLAVAGFALLGSVIAFATIRDKDAAATMQATRRPARQAMAAATD